MTKKKVILDTNVYLSGIIFGGNSRHILDLFIKRKIIVFTSPALLLEIALKLKNKFHWNEDQISSTVKTIAKTSMVVKPKIKINAVMKDKSDNKIIEAALESDANYIITGDYHLLELKKYRNIKILNPRQFISEFLK